MTIQQHLTLSRREFAATALLGVSALAGAAAAEPVPVDAARQVLDLWIDAVMTGDPVQVEKVLAPEFQTMRSDGSGHDKASYLKTLTQQRTRPKFSEIVGTRTGDLMVVRYQLDSDQIIQGKDVKGVSPRLSVFRQDAGRWLICAHANFALLV